MIGQDVLGAVSHRFDAMAGRLRDRIERAAIEGDLTREEAEAKMRWLESELSAARFEVMGEALDLIAQHSRDDERGP